MPRGPNGERRPADVNACAVMVAKIATGEIEEDRTSAASVRLATAKRAGGFRLAQGRDQVSQLNNLSISMHRNAEQAGISPAEIFALVEVGAVASDRYS